MPNHDLESMTDTNLSSFIWSVADLLRGDYKQSEYGRVILPFTVLRRLDCVLEPTKGAVLARLAKREKAAVNPEPFLLKTSGQHFVNTSRLSMKTLMGDQDNIRQNLLAYVQAFSPAVGDIFEAFDFHTQVERLAKAGLLYLVTEKFANIDLQGRHVDQGAAGGQHHPGTLCQRRHRQIRSPSSRFAPATPSSQKTPKPRMTSRLQHPSSPSMDRMSVVMTSIAVDPAAARAARLPDGRDRRAGRLQSDGRE